MPTTHTGVTAVSHQRSRRIAEATTCLAAAVTTGVVMAATASAASASANGVLHHTSASTMHNPLGYVDRVVTTGPTVTVIGWTFDPDTPRSPIRVGVRLDGKPVVVQRTSHSRASVSRHYHRTITTPVFNLAFKASYGTHQLCVYGYNAGRGADTRIMCRTITLRDPYTSRGTKIAALARTFVGKVPFSTAGTSPRTGFDCSGLTRYVYGTQHISLVHSADAQYHQFRTISRNSARPGDLVFFMSGSHVYHVAVYEGENKIVAAATYGEGVKYQSIWTNDVRFGTVLH